MPKQALAKYTRPKQSGLAPRERLFALLDEAREAPLICVCAPAGAGKTSLVASYIEARRPPHLWFQLDATDTDPAGFFANLGALLPKRSHAQLPALLEHNVDNLGAFARLFFRRFFAQLAERCVLVLDCGIELRAHAGLAQIVAEAAQEIPAGCNVVLLTRDMPPPQFARLRLQRSLIEVGWDALKLEPDETAAIINASRQQSAFDARQLHEQCGGWAAGLRLLLEYQPRTGHASSAPSMQGHAALFDYFAAEVFGGLDGAKQDALLRTALLPEVTERAARALTQTSSGWAALCELEQRRLFIDLLGTERPALRYHALFREFLLNQLRAKFSPFELRALQRESAALLVIDKRIDAAVPLLTEAGEWSAASRLILEEANTMLARGHTQTLRAWVAALPSWYVDATPRLLYCLGLAQSTSDPAAGIASLERAYQRFLAQHNTLGQALCAAAIIQAHYFRFDDYTGMRPWADALDLLLRQGLACPSAETELHVCSMLQIALTFVEPDHTSLPQVAERVLSLISRGLDVNQTVVAAGMLLTYFDWFAPDKARLLARYIQPLLHARALTPFNHLWWLMAEVHHYGCIFDAQQVRALVASIEALAEQHALKLSEGALMTLRVKCLDARSASAEADRVLTRGVCALNPARRQEEINLRTYAAELYLQRDDLTAALNDCERALQASRDTGLKISELETLGLRALVLARSGHAEQALRSAQAARAVIVRPLPPKLELHHDFIEAYALLRCDRRDDALSLLGVRWHRRVRMDSWRAISATRTRWGGCAPRH
jgi:ATP/maltotriose-dependent transcriptional regulator MalT